MSDTALAARTVAAVNRLTAGWAHSGTGPREENAVFMAPGLWPLLGTLAAGADGPARGELEQALGLPADQGAAAARELLDALGDIPGVRAALGLWTRAGLPLEPGWLSAVRPGTHRELTGRPDNDRGLLDSWATERTGGAVDAMPVEVDSETLMVLANALTVRTAWAEPFHVPGWGMTPETGPWRGRRLAGLHRTTRRLDDVAVARPPEGALTLQRVRGEDTVDVHLLLGAEELGAPTVLVRGLEVLSGEHPQVTGEGLPEGAEAPGVTVGTVTAWTPEPFLALRTPAFTAGSSHDFLHEPAVYGLERASDVSRGHFAGICRTVPLAVSSARQEATASFTAEGFHAAAVTASGVAAGGMPTARARMVSVRIDRPFGFLAVQRGTGLVLCAGWVRDPTELPGEDGPLL